MADSNDESGVAPRGYQDGKYDQSRPIRRADAFRCYKSWCGDMNRKPFGINAWGAEMVRLGHEPVKTGGHVVFATLKRMDGIWDG